MKAKHRADRACGCTTAGVAAVDEVRHAAWHAEVVAQGGPATGPVDLKAMQAARGMKTDSMNPHAIDQRHIDQGKRSTGAQREASR